MWKYPPFSEMTSAKEAIPARTIRIAAIWGTDFKSVPQSLGTRKGRPKEESTPEKG
jgi:hypothetical protein